MRRHASCHQADTATLSSAFKRRATARPLESPNDEAGADQPGRRPLSNAPLPLLVGPSDSALADRARRELAKSNAGFGRVQAILVLQDVLPKLPSLGRVLSGHEVPRRIGEVAFTVVLEPGDLRSL